MTKLKTIAVLLATSASLGLAAPALAQDKTGTNADMTATADAGPVAQLAMANELYAYGVAQDDALIVLTAAKIALSVDTKDADRTPEETKPIEGLDVTETGEGVDAPVDAAAMLAKAKELAAGNPAIMGLVEDVEAEGARGRIGGASKTLSRLPGGQTDLFKVPFYGGSFAEIGVAGDGDSNLDLLVTDEGGNVVCLDRSYSDRIYCSFTPIWDGYFYIAVQNTGRIRNSYYLLTN